MTGNVPEGAVVVGNAHCLDNGIDESSNLADDRLQVGLLPRRQPGKIKEHLHGSLTARQQMRRHSAQDEQSLVSPEEQHAQL